MAQSIEESSLRRLALRMYDFNLLGTAANYDLRHRSERARSTSDLARLFFRLVKECQPNLFIEAGAKDGGTSRRARRHLETARIVAFEANPYTYRRFYAKIPADHRVEYLHLALDQSPGVVTFHVRKGADGVPLADGHGSLLKRHLGEDAYEEVTVPATTLDEFFSDYPFDHCALWIDVEGASGPVLKGGTNVLRKTSVAMIEVEDRLFWENAWRMQDVADYLYGIGMVPIVRDFQSRYPYNVVFLREALLIDHEVRYLLTHYRSAANSEYQQFRTQPPLERTNFLLSGLKRLRHIVRTVGRCH